MATHPRTLAKLEARILERAAYAVEFELNDPRSGFITVTRVELARDLSSGKIFYSVLGEAGERSRVAHMLADAAGYLQRLIGRVLRVRRMPHLTWVYDDSIAYAVEMDEKIRAALERDDAIQRGEAPSAEPSEESDWESEYADFQEADDTDPKT